MPRDAAQGNLDLILLSVLAAGPAHGYKVLKEAQERSGGLFELSEGAVYPALHRLEERGWLAATWDDAGGRRRRTYRLTKRGKAQLAEGRKSWLSFAAAMRAVLEPS